MSKLGAWLACLLFAFPLTAAPATGLAFSEDGAVLAIGGRKQIELLTVTDGKRESIPCGFPRVTALQFGPKNMLVFGGGAPGESGGAVVLDGKERRVLRQHTNFADWVTCVAVNPKGTCMVAGSADGRATVLSLASDEAGPMALSGHTGPVLGAAFSPDGASIVTGSADRSLKLWSAAEGKMLRSFAHHTEAIHAVVFRPQGEGSLPQCASASDDWTVRIWQPTIGRMVRIVRGHGGPVFALAYTPDGSALFSAGKEGIIRRLDTDSDAVLGEWKGHEEPIYSLAVSPDGSLVASGDWSGSVKLWRFADGTLEPR